VASARKKGYKPRTFILSSAPPFLVAGPIKDLNAWPPMKSAQTRSIDKCEEQHLIVKRCSTVHSEKRTYIFQKTAEQTVSRQYAV